MGDRPLRRRSEEERFWTYVVEGPAPDDCWIWTGAVSDDGYGRFWTNVPGVGQRTMRPQRFLYRALTGIDLPADDMLLHRCDVPLCVHVDLDPARSHLRVGDGRDNMLDRSRRGRAANGFSIERFAGLPRAERARRSRELRDGVRAAGWNADVIHHALSGAGPGQQTLF